MNQPPPRRPLANQRRSPSPGPAGPLRDPRVLALGAGGVVVLLVLLLLFVGPCSILNPSDDGDETLFNCPTIKNAPAPPSGLELASEPRDFSEGKCNRAVPGGPARISIPIDRGKGGRGLSFYTYSGDHWERVRAAELSDDGKFAQVVVDQVPANGAIMRRAADTFQVMGAVPQGQALNDDAQRLGTVVGGYDFVPAPDGSVSGNPTNLKRNDTALLVPVVVANGGAEADAVNAFIGQGERRTAHAANLAQLIQANRLDGVELDYTAVDPARRNDFTDLVRQAADSVHRAGGLVILLLPLPTKEGNNWNTGAYDWNQLGKLVDYIKIAPERDQSIYRRVVPDALTYLSGQVEPRKLVLTLSPLSMEKSDQGLRTMSSLEALSIAAQFTIRDRANAATNSDLVVVADNLAQQSGGVGGLSWDALAATVSFTYQASGQPRTVWIENQYSAAFKTEFIRLWGLGGVAVDDASDNQGFSSIWPAIAPLAEGRELTLLQPNSSLLRPEWQVDNKPYQAGNATITWKTPAETGNHTITLIVSDGEIFVQNTDRISLRAGPVAAATPTPAPSGSPRPGTATPSPTPSPTPTPRR